MKIVILGMPGAGKGTAATHLEELFGWKHVSTGDILRAEVEGGSALGQKVKAILESGALVNDELMGELVKNFVGSRESFILDGYPRTLEQCNLLKEIIDLDKVIYLKVAESIAAERLMGRSETSEIKRSDDKREVIDKRFAIFKSHNEIILNYYREKNLLLEIDASGSMEDVRSVLSAQFSS